MASLLTTASIAPDAKIKTMMTKLPRTKPSSTYGYFWDEGRGLGSPRGICDLFPAEEDRKEVQDTMQEIQKLDQAIKDQREIDRTHLHRHTRDCRSDGHVVYHEFAPSTPIGGPACLYDDDPSC